MNGVLDADNDMLPWCDPRSHTDPVWYKTTISSFRLSEIVEHFQDYGWRVRPLLVVRDVRKVWASLVEKPYGINGITAEDPPLRQRLRRFLSDWKLFRDQEWPILRYESLLSDPEATLRRACEDLDLAWDEGMTRWPKSPQEIANTEHGNLTFWATRGNDLRETLASHIEDFRPQVVARDDWAWLEELFGEFNAAHHYPLTMDVHASEHGCPVRFTPRFDVTRRFKWELQTRPIRWFLSAVGVSRGPEQSQGDWMELAHVYSTEDAARSRSAFRLHAGSNNSNPKRPLAVRLRPLVIGILAAGLICGGAVACYVTSQGRVRLKAVEELSQVAASSEVNIANFTTVGKNAYFNLEPGYRLRYTDGSLVRTLTVRRTTKIVDGVETRLVEEKEEKDGQPIKVVWKYYAFDKTTTALYCFGVHVQRYQEGNLVSHRSWCSGVQGAVFALALPAAPKLGDCFVRGHVKRVYDVIDTTATVVTPAGTFCNCLRTHTKVSGEDGIREKVFAPGVGVVQDGQFKLVEISQADSRNKAEVLN